MILLEPFSMIGTSLLDVAATEDVHEARGAVALGTGIVKVGVLTPTRTSAYGVERTA